MSKTIADLRESLFKALDELQGANPKPELIARANAITDVAQTIINTAKVEVDFIHATGGKDATGFLSAAGAPALPAPPGDVVQQGKGYTVRQHRLK
jgi:hypothetical protein